MGILLFKLPDFNICIYMLYSCKFFLMIILLLRAAMTHFVHVSPFAHRLCGGYICIWCFSTSGFPISLLSSMKHNALYSAFCYLLLLYLYCGPVCLLNRLLLLSFDKTGRPRCHESSVRQLLLVSGTGYIVTAIFSQPSYLRPRGISHYRPWRRV